MPALIRATMVPSKRGAPIFAAALLAPSVDLQWEAPTECPDAAHIQRTIDELLGAHPSDRAKRVRAEVTITHADGFAATLRTDDGTSSGDRELAAASCEELALTVALIIAMAIDPKAGPAPESPAPAEPASPGLESPPEPASSEPTPLPDPPSSSTAVSPGTDATHRDGATPPAATPDRASPATPLDRPLRAVVRAAAGFGYVGLPGPSAVVMVAVALNGPRWRVELDGELWPPTIQTSPYDDAYGIRVLGWTLGLRGCWLAVAGRVEVPLCGGFRSGAIYGRGTGQLDAVDQAAAWVSATAGIGVWGFIHRRFALGLDVDGLVPFTRPAFDLQPSGFTVRMAPAGLRAVFGPVVRLP